MPPHLPNPLVWGRGEARERQEVLPIWWYLTQIVREGPRTNTINSFFESHTEGTGGRKEGGLHL